MPGYIELTDEVHANNPVAWMVFTVAPSDIEYKVFTDERDAEDFAAEVRTVDEDVSDIGPFPLWAAVPGAKPVRFAGGKRR